MKLQETLKLHRIFAVLLIMLGFTSLLVTVQPTKASSLQDYFMQRGTWATAYGDFEGANEYGQWPNVYQGDFNKDGISDLMIKSQYYDNTSYDWYFLKGTGTSFANGGKWATGIGHVWDDSFLAADINGDGYEDMVYRSILASGQMEYGWYRNTGTSFANVTTPLITYGNFEDTPYILDVNGDKKDDIIISTLNDNKNGKYSWHLLVNNGNNQLTSKSKVISEFGYEGDRSYFGDFNGDGKEEFVMATSRNYPNKTLTWSMAQSTGESFALKGVVMEAYGNEVDTAIVGDFNTDGKKDIALLVYRTNPGTDIWDWYVAKSTGTGFASSGKWMENFGMNGDLVYVGNFYRPQSGGYLLQRGDIALGEGRSNEIPDGGWTPPIRWWMVTSGY